MLAGVEEQRCACQGCAVREYDSLELPILCAFEHGDLTLVHHDSTRAQAIPNFRGELGWAIAQQHDVAAPLPEHQREPGAFLVATAVNRQRPVTPLPAIAVGTMMHAAPI